MVAAIENCKLRLSGILTGIETLCIIQSCLNARTTYTWSDLYVKGMSGELGESLLLEDMILSVRKQPSNSLEILLSRLQKISLLELEDIKQELGVLVSSSGDRTKALRSEHDAHLESIRTTIVAHKVELSKHSSSLSDKDLTYTRIINRLDTSLRDLFRECFVEPKSLFLHEIIVFDFRLPHRDVFTPKPRSVIERALTSPHDYLGCSCCGGAKDALSATQPTVAILYQLYLESGSLINTADLWSAFQAVLGKESAEEEDADREQAL